MLCDAFVLVAQAAIFGVEGVDLDDVASHDLTERLKLTFQLSDAARVSGLDGAELLHEALYLHLLRSQQGHERVVTDAELIPLILQRKLRVFVCQVFLLNGEELRHVLHLLPLVKDDVAHADQRNDHDDDGHDQQRTFPNLFILRVHVFLVCYSEYYVMGRQR